MEHFKITNGDITINVEQVGEYTYIMKNSRKKIVEHVDSLAGDGSTTKYWTREAIDSFMKALNMWIKEEK